MPFEFATATRVAFGGGAADDAGVLVRDLGHRALVVTGRTPARAERLLANLRTNGVEAAVFSVEDEPDVATIELGVARARADAQDCVVGIGGGSALDAAKAIAALVPNDGPPLDYLEVIGKGKPLANPSLPCVAIPTTAGTGSEVTRNAVIASPGHGVKVSLRGPSIFPRVAIVDFELTLDLPPALTARTGLDALTQLIEPYLSARANPVTDAICVDGLRRVRGALRAAFHDGANRDARNQMALASLLSGMALTNAGLGAVHGFAAVIGGMFGAPHGAVCAALLAHVTEGNLRAVRARTDAAAALHRFEDLAQLLTRDPKAAPEDGVLWLEALVSELEIPGLAAYGVSEREVGTIVEKAARASSMKGNPVELTPEELTAILTAAL